MSRYERVEYENWDEYEAEGLDDGEREDGSEEEEEEEEEAPPQPTQQEMEYLELRNHLKDSYRKRLKKENASSLGHSQERRNKLPNDNYGSFFGPSQPVLHPRVIQESVSMLENERLTKVPKPNHSNKSSSASTPSNGGSQKKLHVSRPKVVNQQKTKVEKLKVARDYSFLLSDDAELPAATKEPPRNVSHGPTSDARSTQVPPKNKPSFNDNGRQASNGSRQVQNGSRQVQNGNRQASNGNRQASNGNRQESNGSRPIHSESRQASNGNRQVSNGSRQVHSENKQASNGNRQASNGSRQLSNGREEKRNVSSTANVNVRAAPQKLNSANKPISKQVDSRKQLVNNNGSGPGRPLASKPLPSKVSSGTLQNKVPFSGAKSNSSVQSMPKKQPMVSKQSSSLKQPLDQRKGYQDSSKGKILSKQPVPPSRHQISKPSSKVPSRSTFEDRPKKRPARPFSDDEDDFVGSSGVTSVIQKLFRYNPNKYNNGGDSDDSDMEANFNEILREEKRSEKIARVEDEEEARKIEEEERRERLRKQAKKRKR